MAKGDAYDKIKNRELLGAAVESIYARCLNILKKSDDFFLLTVGGDHSIATGSIAAVSEHYGKDELALIWIDAHGDANTPETSPSLNYHGMPAAHVLGWFNRHPSNFFTKDDDKNSAYMKGLNGQRSLKHVLENGGCVHEKNFAYIGLRDIDPAEGQLLRSKPDITIFTMR